MTSPSRATIYRELCQGREVRRWEEFPPDTAARYREIAALFPGHVVRACGSRVDGYYLDETDPNERRALRAHLGKTNPASDYDFVVDHDATPTGPLPQWADRLKPHVAHGRTIPIPPAG